MAWHQRKQRHNGISVASKWQQRLALSNSSVQMQRRRGGSSEISWRKISWHQRQGSGSVENGGISVIMAAASTAACRARNRALQWQHGEIINGISLASAAA